MTEIQTVTQGRGKNKTTTQVRSAVYDPNWHLCMETLRLHKQKWSDPPGSMWVTYTRPRDCFEVRPMMRRAPRRTRTLESRPQIARFALDASVLPLVTETLPLAEAARRALMSLYGRQNQHDSGRSATFAGKDADDRPLAGHRHAYFLPTDEDGDGRLDHLSVYAADGFSVGEIRAMEMLRQIHFGRDRSARPPLRVVLLGTRSAGEQASVPLGPARVWVSATPYLVTRHARTRGRERVDLADRASCEAFFRADIMAQLRSARPDLSVLLGDVLIEPLYGEHGRFMLPVGPVGPVGTCSRSLRPLQFRRFRSKAADDGGRRMAGAFRLTFAEPVRGPIALGHSSHFGMGLFASSSPGMIAGSAAARCGAAE